MLDCKPKTPRDLHWEPNPNLERYKMGRFCYQTVSSILLSFTLRQSLNVVVLIIKSVYTNTSLFNIIGYTDSNWIGDASDRRFIPCYYALIGDLTSLKSKKQVSVPRLSMKAGSHAMSLSVIINQHSVFFHTLSMKHGHDTVIKYGHSLKNLRYKMFKIRV